jgi:hypothetical protein
MCLSFACQNPVTALTCRRARRVPKPALTEAQPTFGQGQQREETLLITSVAKNVEIID